jgi:hypothetical protein
MSGAHLTHFVVLFSAPDSFSFSRTKYLPPKNYPESIKAKIIVSKKILAQNVQMRSCLRQKWRTAGNW